MRYLSPISLWRRRQSRLGLTAGVAVLAALATAPQALAINCTSPADCLARMTLDEKIGQMTQANKNALTSPNDIATFFLGSLLSGGGEGPNGSGGTATQWADMYDNFQNISQTSRLAIPLLYGVDAVHGHNNVAGAVVFPHNIGLGATRNSALVQQVAAVTRDEVLGTGMNWAFAPCVCVPRDDRWGRTYEGFGEDTALVQLMGAAAVRGLQGAGLGPNTVMATAKHYIGDGGTTFGTGSSGFLIDQGNTQLTEAQLRAIHLPPYRDAINAGVGSIMVSYSSWNGLKMHAHQYLITTVLKGELGFRGIVVSDWAGVDQVNPDYATAVRTAINAGVDMVMVPSDYRRFINTLRAEVQAGRVPMSRIDDAVTRILTQKFALGLPTKFRTDRSFTSQVGSAAHRAVARQAVRESMVLLKNDGVLPLSKTATYRVVVGGSHVDNLGYQMGGWSITWQGGSGTTTTGGTTFWQAIQAAKPANVTLQNVGTNTASSYTGDIGIAVIGETPYAEGAGDSSTLGLSTANVNQVNDICSRTTRCIVILMSGRPLIINGPLARSTAFIAAWLPGTEGRGITDVLFGDFPFTGKLPMSWPNDLSQEPINSGDGKAPLFAFNYGLTTTVGPTPTPTTTPTPTPTPVGTLSIDSGGAGGGGFAADHSVTGGTNAPFTTVVDTSQLSSPVPPQAVLQSERYGNFTYTLGGFAANTNHVVTLYFSESYWTAAGQRVFNVLINGTQVLTNFDVLASAGGQGRAIQRSFTRAANASGQFVIQFVTVTDNAKVDAITIAPATTPTPTARPTPTPTARPTPTPTARPTPTPTATPTPTPTPTGSTYPAWAEGQTYTTGQRVSYQGANYECLQTHTAWAGANWNPKDTPTLWKAI